MRVRNGKRWTRPLSYRGAGGQDQSLYRGSGAVPHASSRLGGRRAAWSRRRRPRGTAQRSPNAGTLGIDAFGRRVLGIGEGDEVVIHRIALPRPPGGMAHPPA